MTMTMPTRARYHRLVPAARRPIVVAIGDTGGVAALRVARALAERDGTHLVLVSAVEPPPIYDLEAAGPLMLPWTIDEQLSERHHVLHKRLHGLGWTVNQPGAPQLVVTYGGVPDSVNSLARDRDARLIIMGIGPHDVARRLISAGAASSTSRHAPCPVLAVSDGAHGVPHSAVIAIDFSSESVNAAGESLALLADDAVIHLVHVWRKMTSMIANTELDESTAGCESERAVRFDRVRSILGRDRALAFNDITLEGKTAECLLEIARRKHVDLIVAGTHGYSMLDRWLLGSTSTALLHGAECSVLLVPAPRGAERARLERQMGVASEAPEPADVQSSSAWSAKRT